jgi:arylsulfate sulfotransferase
MSSGKLLLIALVVGTLCLIAPRTSNLDLWAQTTPVLFPSVPSSQPVGTNVVWTATQNSGWLYQFSVADSTGVFSVNQDFSTSNTYGWAPLSEGSYIIQVVAQPPAPASAIRLYRAFAVTPIATSASAISPTQNPLVALYSAPPCPLGSSMYVQFGVSTAPTSYWSQTDSRPCLQGKSMNFYIAGMLPSVTYSMRHFVVTNSQPDGGSSLLPFTTGALNHAVPVFTVVSPPTIKSSLSQQVLLNSMLDLRFPSSNVPVATDVFGRVIWYYGGNKSPYMFAYYTHAVAGGNLMMLYSIGRQYYVGEIDLAGNSLKLTNMDRINAQLTLRGEENVIALHHDALRTPAGQTLVFGMLEHTNVNPPLLGDLIIGLDQNYQVIWTWNSFKHLPLRLPVLHETCAVSYGPACPASTPTAIDLLHSNCLSYTSDHNLLHSMRHQDWVEKINFQDGAGNGTVVWKLGKGGDFAVNSTDPSPWFSHQHDPEWVGTNTISLYDNGNTRCNGATQPCNSRGQIWQINEQTKVATLSVNLDLGVYSDRQGSATILKNGNFQFVSGYVEPNPTSRIEEYLPDGTPNLVITSNQTVYRTPRMTSLYQQ